MFANKEVFIPVSGLAKRTADHLDEVLTKITWVGGSLPGGIALIPEIMLAGIAPQSPAGLVWARGLV